MAAAVSDESIDSLKHSTKCSSGICAVCQRPRHASAPRPSHFPLTSESRFDSVDMPRRYARVCLQRRTGQSRHPPRPSLREFEFKLSSVSFITHRAGTLHGHPAHRPPSKVQKRHGAAGMARAPPLHSAPRHWHRPPGPDPAWTARTRLGRDSAAPPAHATGARPNADETAGAGSDDTRTPQRWAKSVQEEEGQE